MEILKQLQRLGPHITFEKTEYLTEIKHTGTLTYFKNKYGNIKKVS